MNQKPLDEMIREAVDEYRARTNASLNVDEVTRAVLESPDLALLMKGVDAHDRSGDLDDVYLRDIRRKVVAYLEEQGQKPSTS